MSRRRFSAEFKTRVVLEFEAGSKTGAQICREFDVGSTSLSRWVEQYRKHGESAWAKIDPEDKDLAAAEKRIAELEGALGRATLDTEFLKRCLRRANLPLP